MTTTEVVLERESRFHDAWASGEEIDPARVEAAFNPLTAPENRYILDAMGDLRGRKVLDLGCGFGETSIFFASRGAEVTACDLSPGMIAALESAARRHGVSLRTMVGPAEGLDLPRDHFDIAYAANLIHHIQDRDRFYRSIAAALRPGGRFFSWDPLAYNPLIAVYRRIATSVRTVDEKPLTFGEARRLGRYFDDVGHREFWILGLSLFLKYYLWDRHDPNRVRYWRRILEETEASIGWWFEPLRKADRVLTRIPLLRRLAWNTVMWGTRAP